MEQQIADLNGRPQWPLNPKADLSDPFVLQREADIFAEYALPLLLCDPRQKYRATTIPDYKVPMVGAGAYGVNVRTWHYVGPTDKRTAWIVSVGSPVLQNAVVFHHAETHLKEQDHNVILFGQLTDPDLPDTGEQVVMPSKATILNSSEYLSGWTMLARRGILNDLALKGHDENDFFARLWMGYQN